MIFSLRRKSKADRELLLSANSLLSHAKKVMEYRRHVLGPTVTGEIVAQRDALNNAIRSGVFSDVRNRSDRLRRLLEVNGGDIFPVKFLNENIEVMFVAALLAIAIRTFFIQSFQIPTNSMYPTYFGMTHRIIHGTDGEFFWKKLLHRVRYCGSSMDLTAQVGGEVSIPLVPAKYATGGSGNYIVPHEMVSVRQCFGLRNVVRRKYALLVDNVKHAITTPADFPLDRVLLEKFCGGATSWKEFLAKSGTKLQSSGNVLVHGTGVRVAPGDSIIRFEVLPGDILFVDKISHNFRPPGVGESVVFRTDKIDAFANSPKFFIKRLVGRPGDRLSVENGKLLSNGKPLVANEILKNLSAKSGDYLGGYCPAGLLATGKEVTVPDGKYFMLGDNSSDSYDSRFWGFVPQRSICGKPLVIFYPLSARFGKCK
ncbi:MAG: signal peptidase I [Puniceicoccales bacterium]|jgi:signal peptidase I|nr:signal peptidase I [Puniceicoccales bacterium]